MIKTVDKKESYIWSVFWRFYIVSTLIAMTTSGIITYTNILKEPAYIQYNITVIQFSVAVVFILFTLINREGIVSTIKTGKLKINKKTWTNIKYYFVSIFIFMGPINVIVVNYATLNFWVDYKLFINEPLFILLSLFVISLSLKFIKESNE